MPLNDSKWRSATSLVFDRPIDARRNVALFGISTYQTSVSPRSSTSTPQAVRKALERYSTWSWASRVDLAEYVAVVDHGDLDDPDGEGARGRLASMLEGVDAPLTIFLGGDNAATWHAMGAFAGDHLDKFGLITLDAHLDMRDGRSNGSPVRQLLEEGLDPRHVVQVGLAEYSNSPTYARDSLKRGVRIVERDAFHREEAAVIARRALEVARQGGRKVYVDIDLDVADRSVVPGCPASAPGGLSADEVRRFVREIASSPHVAAIDFTEIDVDQDAPDQRTVRLAALLVLEALAGVQRRLS
ncbi:MAG: arginase family protein [Acidimicrobiales bacterium]